MAGSLRGKTALIVGGSGGVGRGISRLLAHRGADVRVHGGNSQSRLDDAVAEARELGATAKGFLATLTPGPLDEGLVSHAEGVDILVVAYGPYLERSVEQMSPEDWRHMIDLNLTLAARLVSLTLPTMRERGWGRVLLFGSERSNQVRGYRQVAAYAAAKHGLASLCQSIAKQNGPQIVCNMICPGYVDTEYYSSERRAQISKRLAPARMLTVGEVADVAIRLLEPRTNAVNGALIPVDFGV